MLFRVAVAVLAVAAIVLLGWRLYQPGTAPGGTGQKTTTPAGSDYYMRDATIYQMNKQGELAYRLELGKTLHYPNDSARLKDIHVRYEGDTRTYWTLDAPRGRIPPDSRALHLTGGVTLRHPKPKGQTVVIKTDSAWFRAKQDVIETKAHVTATAPGRVIEADGLYINFDKDVIKLRNNVQVRYTP